MKTKVTLSDVVNRPQPPVPWAEGEKIPWNEPGFSARMLKEHLSQAHDAASRRLDTIAQHVDWIHHDLLHAMPSKILDLACGPGLYASRLCALGHTCVGIDFSPASIAYARDHTPRDGARCTYRLADIRHADYDTGFGLVMLIYGEFNVFKPREARLILEKAQRSLAPGGLLLLEPHTFSAVRELGEAPASWYTSTAGLFSAEPHLYLHESFWHPDERVTTDRFFIVDAASGAISRYASCTQAYTDAEYRAMLAGAGFGDVRFYPSLIGKPDDSPGYLTVAVGRKLP
jgi:SAM-dependent methyltransferase